MSKSSGFGAALRDRWRLDPQVTYLNHGSFGAAPRAVLDQQDRLRLEIEVNPSRFLWDALPGRLRAAAGQVARWLGGQADDWVFVDNATTGINAILGSLDPAPGSAILISDQTYGAVAKAVRHHADRQGLQVRQVALPRPARSAEQLVETLAAALDERVALALIDQVVSPSGLVLPVAQIAARCRAVGAALLVDGAHGPGMLEVDVPALGADWYVANLHKWAFAPRGCGLLWATPARQATLHPTVISWGQGEGFTAAFDWPGTRDFTPWLAAPAGLAFGQDLGWPAVMAWNRRLAIEQGDVLATALGSETAGPPALTGALRAIRLPVTARGTAEEPKALSRRLSRRHRIEVPVHAYGGALWVRISAQVYNQPADYEALITALRAELT